jgi:hypothetical protein
MNEVEINNEPFEEISLIFKIPKLNPTKLHKLKKKKPKKFLEQLHAKEKYENPIIEIHYVGHLIYK